MNRGSDLSSWTFQRPFRIESQASMEEVLHALAQLEEPKSFFSSSRNEMSILPVQDGYTFRYKLRRRNKSTTYTSAFAEGEIWQDETGTVILEGTSQVESWGLYGSLALFMFIGILITFISQGMTLIFPFIFMIAGAVTLLSRYADRNKVIEHLTDAVGNAGSITHQYSKEKNRPQTEKAKHEPVRLRDAVRKNSVWDEAISEYEDDDQGSR